MIRPIHRYRLLAWSAHYPSTMQQTILVEDQMTGIQYDCPILKLKEDLSSLESFSPKDRQRIEQFLLLMNEDE